MRYIILIAGIVVVLSGFWFRSQKKLTVDFAAVWGILGALLIFIGVVSPFSDWIEKIIGEMEEKVTIFGIFFLAGIFWGSLKYSRVKMQNQELAVRISLLLQENERMLSELDEKDIICRQYDGTCRGRDGTVGASKAD